MAPKKDKSKVEDEAVANLSTGWRRSKMSESPVQELENMGLLQIQGVIQCRAGEGEDYPFEGTLEIVMFRDFVECGLAVPVSEFFHTLSAILFSPIASFDSTIQLASFYIYSFL